MLYRGTAVLKHKSGLPKDNVTNTFHIDVAGGGIGDAERVAEDIRDFYVGLAAGQGAALSTYIGSQISDLGHEVRMYPIDVATGESLTYEGAPPEHVELFDFVSRTDESEGLPSEVALCLSFRRNESGNVPRARRTGRIYFGPIEAAHVDSDTPVFRPVPTAALMGDLLDAGNGLVDSLAGAGDALVVYSRPFAGRFGAVKDNGDPKPDLPARNGAIYVVNQIFCDDSFDTQRRRGEKPITRTAVTV